VKDRARVADKLAILIRYPELLPRPRQEIEHWQRLPGVADGRGIGAKVLRSVKAVVLIG
jgi:hypothetical protein